LPAELLTEKKPAYASVNQAACAMRFLFAVVLGREKLAYEIPMAKVPKRLPQILTREEVARSRSITGTASRCRRPRPVANKMQSAHTCGKALCAGDRERRSPPIVSTAPRRPGGEECAIAPRNTAFSGSRRRRPVRAPCRR
jgi:hypothetical protein